MTVKHLVLFQFKAGVGADAIKEANMRMLGLKDGCIHPTTQKQYIKSLTGGKDNSIEGAQNGITHAFVVDFETTEDRNYYVEKDPFHEEFKAFVGPLAEKVIVVDYSEGVF
ncbi:stress responsive A/B barrel domain protein [Hypoxylon fragiforme]|uniref:stress responsive A/B barrel domain protein n=1 Tax=Hypoxylon fragiforme TaxID=63214 RepID=UPI0020C5F1AC|nr:stress responsive A/B barrel domain protein [Hypoxylon fragiforme]KAI2608973.1 stress responsive A/B barrel domain protein [Hypoxylon fragiforme]